MNQSLLMPRPGSVGLLGIMLGGCMTNRFLLGYISHSRYYVVPYVPFHLP